jgi:LmbE family N-acetylglucosaminyl deacetylase
MSDKPECVIIAPHFDDEIIGCYEVIMNPLIKPIIVYMQDDEERKQEALKLKTFIDRIQVQLFQKSIPSVVIDPKNVLYFPDPVYEIHPDHRKFGAIGEDLLRQGFNVVFYNTNMNAPYIHEVPEFKQKRHLLEKVYPSQKNLWKYENKYFLFEGRCRWIM